GVLGGLGGSVCGGFFCGARRRGVALFCQFCICRICFSGSFNEISGAAVGDGPSPAFWAPPAPPTCHSHHENPRYAVGVDDRPLCARVPRMVHCNSRGSRSSASCKAAMASRRSLVAASTKRSFTP